MKDKPPEKTSHGKKNEPKAPRREGAVKPEEPTPPARRRRSVDGVSPAVRVVS